MQYSIYLTLCYNEIGSVFSYIDKKAMKENKKRQITFLS